MNSIIRRGESSHSGWAMPENNPLLAQVMTYHKMGMNLIPIGKDKRPVYVAEGSQLPTDTGQPFTQTTDKGKGGALPWKEAGYQHTPQTWTTVSHLPWRGALGLAAISGPVSGGLLCLDFDGVRDTQVVLQVLAGLGLPAFYRWVVKSGSGQGFHLWLRCPDLDLQGKGRLDHDGKAGGHIELRYTHHYTLLPPSLHPSGERYTFLNDQPTEAPAIVASDRLLEAYALVTVKHAPPPPPPPAAPAPVSPPPPNRPASRPANRGFDKRARGWAQARLTRASAENPPGGEGNAWLNKTAYEFGLMASLGWLTESEIESALFSSPAAQRRSQNEALATIRSGLRGSVQGGNAASDAAELERELKGFFEAEDKREREEQARKKTTPEARKRQALSPEELEELQAYGLSDVGNGQRLVSLFGANLRFCHEWKNWLIYREGRWELDQTAEIERLAKQVAKTLQAEAEAIPSEREKVKEAFTKHAQRSESAGKIHAMIDMARSEWEVKTQVGDLDTNPMLLNCQNGVLNLKNGELCPHDPAYMLTKQVKASYHPEATCPAFENFLDRIMAGNPSLITFLRRAIGYSLTGRTSEQVIFFCYGTGANGKSTLLEALRFLLADYSQNTPITALMRKSDGASPTPDLARLKGARFVTAVEAEENQHLSESTVKAITGGDTITARNLFSDPFEFRPELKLWVGTNYKPRISGMDNGIWRRIRLVPFAVTIPPEERDPFLAQKLQAEADGILAWAVRGCLEWQAKGLGTPPEVIEATNAYRSEQDVMAAFLSECCVQGVNMVANTADMYSAYKVWCEDNNERVLSQRFFSLKLKERGFDSYKSHGRMVWLHIGLLAGEQGEFGEA